MTGVYIDIAAEDLAALEAAAASCGADLTTELAHTLEALRRDAVRDHAALQQRVDGLAAVARSPGARVLVELGRAALDETRVWN